MIVWILLVLLIAATIVAAIQTFRYQERELYVDFLHRQIKLLENPEEEAKQFKEFCEFHRSLRELHGLPDIARQKDE